jgi:hypothetical protein
MIVAGIAGDRLWSDAATAALAADELRAWFAAATWVNPPLTTTELDTLRSYAFGLAQRTTLDPALKAEVSPERASLHKVAVISVWTLRVAPGPGARIWGSLSTGLA